jgi:hypothetical protein
MVTTPRSFWKGSKSSMRRSDFHQTVQLDMNNAEFQDQLFAMGKADRHSAMETLGKLRRMTWDQVYRDSGLKWEKILSIGPPDGVPAVCSLRLSQSRRAIVYRDGNLMKLLSIPPDHDSTYGRK